MRITNSFYEDSVWSVCLASSTINLYLYFILSTSSSCLLFAVDAGAGMPLFLLDTCPEGAKSDGQHVDREHKAASTRRKAFSDAQARVAIKEKMEFAGFNNPTPNQLMSNFKNPPPNQLNSMRT